MNLVVSTSVRTGNIPSLIQEIQKCLDPKHDDFWAQNLSYCWGSEKEIRRYINHLDIDRAYSDPVTAMESMYMLIDHSYAMERGELKPITKFGRDMLQRYTEDVSVSARSIDIRLLISGGSVSLLVRRSD